jgi:hypothetical protein
VVGIAVEHAALEDVPTPAPPDAADADVVGACVELLAPSPGNCTACCGSIVGDALTAPIATLPVVVWPADGRVEVGTARGSEAVAAIALEVASSDDAVPVEAPLELDGVVIVSADELSMVVGATPACCVGCPTGACGIAWELVWACAAPTPPSHIAITKMNMRCIAFSHHQTERRLRAPSADWNAFAPDAFRRRHQVPMIDGTLNQTCRRIQSFNAMPSGSTA